MDGVNEFSSRYLSVFVAVIKLCGVALIGSITSEPRC